MKITKYLTKILLSIIFLLSSIIYIKLNDNNKSYYEKIFLENSISFTKASNYFQKYFGEVIPLPKEDKYVFNDNSEKKMDDYLNGKIIYMESDSNIISLSSGIIVFIGEKQGYNKTMIVQGNDGVDIFYGNILDTKLNLYDYVKKGDILATSKDNLYVSFFKDNNYITYEEYIYN